MAWLFLHTLVEWVTPVLLPAAIVLGFRLTLERLQPMTAPRGDTGALNVLACLIWNASNRAFSPIPAILLMLLMNHLGSGLIELPDHGPGMIAGFIAFALCMDLSQYLFHRAEHAIPALWALHSLHHSDRHFDASTGLLHHWGAGVVAMITTSVPLAVAFKAPPVDMALWALINNHAYLVHANLKWDFGRFWWLLTSPVYHRTHHSAQPEHFDSNFSGLFPVWDLIFGTARRVDLAALPAVGLGEGSEPRSILDIVLWTQRRRNAVHPS